MNVNAKRRKRDRYNFISVILTKISLVKNFHQRIALSITSKSILNHITLKFYIRKRYDKYYLYTRLFDNFGSIKERHKFMSDILTLVDNLQLESTQGHYTGFILDVTTEEQSLICFLKLVALLSSSNDFYVKRTKLCHSYYNTNTSSMTPIHIQLLNSNISKLQNEDLIKHLCEEIKEKCEK